LLLLLAACGGGKKEWGGAQYGAPTSNPVGIGADISGLYGALPPELPSPEYKASRRIVALLPLSGQHANTGTDIKRAIEMAFMQKYPKDISLMFVDMSGAYDQKYAAAESALRLAPDVIIGPLFSEDAKIVGKLKPSFVPAISMTSDMDSLGDGVFSVALLPYQSAESAIRQMSADGHRKFMILAPDNASGYASVNAALGTSGNYGVETVGLYYYKAGDMDSIRRTAQRGSLQGPRTSANKRAKEILSDALLERGISASDRASLEKQLDAIKKKDTLGPVPYDSVLFLGDLNDSKALASFLRYYDVQNQAFYGTALFEGAAFSSDPSLSGAKYSALRAESEGFVAAYSDVTGKKPGRLESFAYDATMMAIGALNSDHGLAAYILNPSGYVGLDGLFRLRPDGRNERALQTMRLNADGTAEIISPAARDFVKPIYSDYSIKNGKRNEIEVTGKVNVMDYINLPPYMRDKYTDKSFAPVKEEPVQEERTEILPEDDSEPIETDPEFRPTNMDTIDRTMIEEVRLN
jgi:ABC-type branched-subunit amino acid transport system substrate-binding protein